MARIRGQFVVIPVQVEPIPDCAVTREFEATREGSSADGACWSTYRKGYVFQLRLSLGEVPG